MFDTHAPVSPLSLRLACLVTLASAACGAPTPPAAPHDEHDEHGEHEGGHAKLAGAAHDFHETLAPLWHAPKGPEREAKTCDASATFETRAANVLREASEGGRAAAQGLVAAVGDLKSECAKAAGARADFEAKFAAVHEAFHKVAEEKR